MRAYHVSYRGRASIMDLIFPRGKDTISNAFTSSVESVVIPPIDEFQIVLYDEQHPKKGRTQKFRLTLLDGATGRQSPRSVPTRKIPGPLKRFLSLMSDSICFFTSSGFDCILPFISMNSSNVIDGLRFPRYVNPAKVGSSFAHFDICFLRPNGVTFNSSAISAISVP